MTQFLLFTRHPYEEPHHLNLSITVGNSRQQAELEIYCNADDLRLTANNLQSFPKIRDDSFLWELGSEIPELRSLFYFRFRAYQINSSGKCAIEFRFCNNRFPPDRIVSEFSIIAMPADLDRLAGLFADFAKLETLSLRWEVIDPSQF